jgi:hypothetical protein
MQEYIIFHILRNCNYVSTRQGANKNGLEYLKSQGHK